MTGTTANTEQASIVPTMLLRRALPDDGSDERRRRDPIGQLRADLEIVLGTHVDQALLLFLLMTARYAGRACSAALIGPSGGGKTTVATTITKMLPPEDSKYVTDVTYAALTAGFGWDVDQDAAGNRLIDMRRRLLVLDESVDIRCPQTMACLRQATSTEWTRRTKMDRGQAVTTMLRGPLTLVDCRLAAAEIDYQTANRLIPILLPSDPETLKTIMGLTASRPTLAGRRRDQQVKDVFYRWCNFLRRLDHDLEVVIDFADQIQLDACHAIGGRITHGPRLLNAVHSLISAIAWLRQGSRKRHDLDGSGPVIFATIDDYRVANDVLLAGNVLDERPAIPAAALNLLKLWQTATATDGNPPVTAPGLYHRIDVAVDRGSMTRHLKPLLELELVRELPGRNRNRHKEYELTPIGLRASTVSLLHTLPSPESIKIGKEEDFNAIAET